MPRILIDPGQLRSVSEKIQKASNDLQSINRTINSALENLSWEANEKKEFSQGVDITQLKAKVLLTKLAEMSRNLEHLAASFEHADSHATEIMSRLPSAGGTAWWMNQSFLINEWLQSLNIFPEMLREIWATIFTPIYPILPVISGTVTIASLINHPSWFPESTQETIPKTQYQKPGSQYSSRTTFGDLLNEEYKEPRELPKGEAKKGQPSKAPQRPNPPEDLSKWQHDVPFQNQHELKYKGDDTAYACVLASTHMILEYWHNEDPRNRTMSAQKLLDINIRQGEYENKAMPPKHVYDELHGLGYEPVPMPNATKEKLEAELKKGPVLAIVKVGMKNKGDRHAVVVTGISEDGTVVKVNDPDQVQDQGKGRAYSWKEFDNSWSSNFGDTKRNFLIIHPKED